MSLELVKPIGRNYIATGSERSADPRTVHPIDKPIGRNNIATGSKRSVDPRTVRHIDKPLRATHLCIALVYSIMRFGTCNCFLENHVMTRRFVRMSP